MLTVVKIRRIIVTNGINVNGQLLSICQGSYIPLTKTIVALSSLLNICLEYQATFVMPKNPHINPVKFMLPDSDGLSYFIELLYGQSKHS